MPWNSQQFRLRALWKLPLEEQQDVSGARSDASVKWPWGQGHRDKEHRRFWQTSSAVFLIPMPTIFCITMLYASAVFFFECLNIEEAS